MSFEKKSSRFLAWDACYNARELGGYPAANGRQIRWRTLVRADNLHRLTPDGQEALCDYGVRTIIDLRLAHEVEMHPNPFAAQQRVVDGPRYLNLPLHDPEADAAMSKADSLQGEYIILLEMSNAQVAAVIEATAAALKEGAVLVHCHGGKDRTGIVMALLLSLAGTPRETIVDDYVLSEAMLEPLHSVWLEEQSRIKGQPVDRPRWMQSRPETMQGMLDFLDRQYGGVEGYLRSAGVTQAGLAEIRKHLVEPAAHDSC